MTDMDKPITPPVGAPADGEKTAEAAKDKKGKKVKDKTKRTVMDEINSWIALILLAVVMASLVRGLIAEPIRVDGRSMVNTLQNGEIVLVSKLRMLRGDYKRGDVVICHYPKRKSASVRVGATITLDVNTAFVKRLVALPGDAVAVMDGRLYVNDTLVEEDYIDFPPSQDYPRRVLGEDEYFVMGDNRANSHDSRASDVGPISEKMIVGHAKWVVYPFSKIRAVK